MADFYVNFGSKGAKLVGKFTLGSINLRLHNVNGLYVVSKNRTILSKNYNVEKSLKSFRDHLFFEFPDSLFNN